MSELTNPIPGGMFLLLISSALIRVNELLTHKHFPQQPSAQTAISASNIKKTSQYSSSVK